MTCDLIGAIPRQRLNCHYAQSFGIYANFQFPPLVRMHWVPVPLVHVREPFPEGEFNEPILVKGDGVNGFQPVQQSTGS